MKRKIKKSANQRLLIVAGQVRAIQGMVNQEKYCVDIITQIEAVRKALSSVGNMILQNHLETHIIHQIKHGEERKATIEILKIYRLAQK